MSKSDILRVFDEKKTRTSFALVVDYFFNFSNIATFFNISTLGAGIRPK